MAPLNTIGFDIDIQRIDERPSSHFQVPRLLIDGQVVADFVTFAVDLNELIASQTEAGERYILTCWCGAPDCARIDAGITVSHTADRVHWRPSYPVRRGPLVFHRQQYQDAVAQLLASIQEVHAQAEAEGRPLGLVPYGCDDFLLPQPPGPPR